MASKAFRDRLMILRVSYRGSKSWPETDGEAYFAGLGSILTV